VALFKVKPLKINKMKQETLEEAKQETHICKWCKAETWQSDDECYAKQETIEEAAYNYAANKKNRTSHLIGFREGVKWQQEQILYFLYSEITERRDYSASKMCEVVIEFIENM
jgi:hypothetical protein